jgi:hypothetical protein
MELNCAQSIDGYVNGVNGVLYSVKHVTVDELIELVEAIAGVNSKSCGS